MISPVISIAAATRAPELTRSRFLEICRLPVDKAFKRHPWVNSVTLLVAQYWNDEAEDAVHAHWVFSSLPTPDLDEYARELYVDHGEAVAEPVNLPPDVDGWDLHAELSYGLMIGSALPHRLDPSFVAPWDANGWSIPLFAAYCPEGAGQDDDLMECYRPVAVFRRSGLDDELPALEFVGVQIRPWLDGVLVDPDDR